MSLFGSAAGGIASAFGSLASGALNAHYNRQAMDAAAAQNIYQYQHRYQWAMQDMKKAGLNPILAATSGIAGNVNGASALSSSMPDIGNSIIGLQVVLMMF